MKRDNKGRFVSETEKVYMTGYKAFGEGMKCRNKQYAENTVFEEPHARICEMGMHFCECPSDVLKYYSLCDAKGVVQVAPVEALKECITDDGIKFCTTKLRVGKRLTVKEFVDLCITITREKRISYSKKRVNSGADSSVNSGKDFSVNSGADSSVNSGKDFSVNSGADSSVNSGAYFSVNSGASGSVNSGADRSVNSGADHAACSGGKNSICVCFNGKCKGGEGSFIAIANRDGDGKILEAASAIVDGKTIKSDTWYELKDGRLVEVE